MSTRMHRFVPLDVRHVPAATETEDALSWLRSKVAAYKIEALKPGHITFIDCGGGLDVVACPSCKTDVGGEFWKDWMDGSWTEAGGFDLTGRQLPCCGKTARLEALYFDPKCAFGSFEIAITDTMTTMSEAELDTLKRDLEIKLGCPLHRIDAHY
jgi:hypothetical protein